MKRILPILVVSAFVTTGCRSVDTATAPPGLPLRYHNEQYGLTFYLPASWEGYSVSTNERDNYSNDPMMVELFRTPVLTISKSVDNALLGQGIYISIYTRNQWEILSSEELLSSLYQEGTMLEIWHNDKYVFAIGSSEGDDGDGAANHREENDIVRKNESAHHSRH